MAEIRVAASGLRFPEGPVAIWPTARSSWARSPALRSPASLPTARSRRSAMPAAGRTGSPPAPTAHSMSATTAATNTRRAGFCRPAASRTTSGGTIQRIDPRTGETRDPLQRMRRPQAVGAERHRLRPPGRVLFHRSRQDAGARPRPWRALLRAARRIEDRRAGPSDAEPERRRPVARRKDGLRRRHRNLAPLRLRHRLARRSAQRARSRRPMAAASSAGCRASSASTAWPSRPPATSASATLITGHITVIAPDGRVVRQVKMPDVYPTNICFGGADMKTAYITLSGTGQLAAWIGPSPGLRLNFMA